MMRTLLKKIREVEPINKPIRFILKQRYLLPDQLFFALQKRWPTSGFIECEFKGEKFIMYNKCDDGLLHYFYYKVKYQEETDLSLFKELAKSSRCSFDIGANTGLFSIVASIKNTQTRIFAFEPYTINADRLRINVKANGLSNVEVINEALGDQLGSLEIAVPRNNSISAVASANHEFSEGTDADLEWQIVTVPVNTIDNFRKKLSSPIDLIKCDVETFEMSVFKGGFNTLEADRPTIIFESFLNDERRMFFDDILKRFDYFLYLIQEDGIAYIENGFTEANSGLNYLITPIKPKRNFINYQQTELIRTELLQRPM